MDHSEWLKPWSVNERIPRALKAALESLNPNPTVERRPPVAPRARNDLAKAAGLVPETATNSNGCRPEIARVPQPDCEAVKDLSLGVDHLSLPNRHSKID